jgi:hypothetical protein
MPCKGLHSRHAKAFIPAMRRPSFPPCEGLHSRHAKAFFPAMPRPSFPPCQGLLSRHAKAFFPATLPDPHAGPDRSPCHSYPPCTVPPGIRRSGLFLEGLPNLRRVWTGI